MDYLKKLWREQKYLVLIAVFQLFLSITGILSTFEQARMYNFTFGFDLITILSFWTHIIAFIGAIGILTKKLFGWFFSTVFFSYKIITYIWIFLNLFLYQFQADTPMPSLLLTIPDRYAYPFALEGLIITYLFRNEIMKLFNIKASQKKAYFFATIGIALFMCIVSINLDFIIRSFR